MPKLKKKSYDQRQQHNKEIIYRKRLDVAITADENITDTQQHRINSLCNVKIERKRKSNKTNLYDEDENEDFLIQLLPKRQAVESLTNSKKIDQNLSKEAMDNNIVESSESHSDKIDSCSGHTMILPEIILGEFSQFFNEFPLPHHQCTAMSASALAYAFLKPVITWQSRDLDNILRVGQIYYKDCMSYLLLNNPKYEHTYLEALQLIQNLKVLNRTIQLDINTVECRGGPHIEGVFVNYILNFEKCEFTNCVITYNEYSYGLLRLHNINNISSYAFFDSHGRNDDGSVPGSKSAIMFFKNIEDFIIFFLNEYPILSPLPNEVHDISKYLILVPLHFIDITDENDIEDGNSYSPVEGSSSDWDSSDELPLIELKKKIQESEHICIGISDSNHNTLPIKSKKQSIALFKNKPNILSKKEKNKLKMKRYRLNMTTSLQTEIKTKVRNIRRKKIAKETKDQRIKRLKNKAQENKRHYNKTKNNHLNAKYEWPAPIPKSDKEKCLIEFLKKMSKEELLQRTCSICNKIDFNKNFNKLKFSELKQYDILQPIKELVNIIPIFQEVTEDVHEKKMTNCEELKLCVNEEIQNKKQIEINKFIITETNNVNLAPNVIICEETKSYNVLGNRINVNNANKKNSQSEIKKNENTDVLEKSYFCYKNIILYKNGIDPNTKPNDNMICDICSNCFSSLNRKKPVTPLFSPANNAFIGDVPKELQNLTIPEEQLISLYRHNKCVIKIQTRTYDASTKQSKINGNVIIFQQNISSIAKILPLSQDSLCDNIKVVFVGSNPPSRVESYRLLRVRRDKVYKALKWLIINNPLYRDIKISTINIENLPIDDIPDSLWITMDSTTETEAANASRSGYVQEPSVGDNINIHSTSTASSITENYEKEEIPMALSTSALVDVDGVDTLTNDVQNHILKNTFDKQKKNQHTNDTYYMIPHSEKPVSQYGNPLRIRKSG